MDEPVVLRALADYADDAGNTVTTSAERADDVRIVFRGSRNRVEIGEGARLTRLHLAFDCSDGVVVIGPSRRRLGVSIRVGQDSAVRIGRNVSSTEVVVLSATEGTTVTVGDDVMFASLNQVRADDGHPIFDVRSGRRVNVSQSITIGNHVWLGRSATVLAGVEIGEGSVVAYGAVVTRDVPNNCIAAGVPARVVKRDIAWERPHLSLAEPYYKPDATTVTKSRYWRLTRDDPATLRGRARRRMRHSRPGRWVSARLRRAPR